MVQAGKMNKLGHDMRHVLSILVTHRAAIHTIEALGNWHPHLVSYVEQVVRAGQLHLRTVSRASAFKLNREYGKVT